MADGYLEKHYADYEARKAARLHRAGAGSVPARKRQPRVVRQIDRPEDEAL